MWGDFPHLLLDTNISPIQPLYWTDSRLCYDRDPRYMRRSCLYPLTLEEEQRPGERGLIVAAVWDQFLLTAIGSTLGAHHDHINLFSWLCDQWEMQTWPDWQGGAFFTVHRGIVNVHGEDTDIGRLPRIVERSIGHILQGHINDIYYEP